MLVVPFDLNIPPVSLIGHYSVLYLTNLEYYHVDHYSKSLINSEFELLEKQSFRVY